MYCLGYVSVYIVRAYPTWVRTVMMVCLLASVASLFASSFATKIWHLILLQGVVNGTACGILYPAVLFWVPEWFDKRRNFASSTMQSGSGVGGIVWPLVIDALLKRVGYAWTMRTFSIALLIFTIPVVLSVKPRLPLRKMESSESLDRGHIDSKPVVDEKAEVSPISEMSAPVIESDWKYLKSPLFLSVNAAVFIQGLGHFCVSFYVSTYTVSMGYSRSQGTIILSIFNAAFVIASVGTGYWCDRNPYPIVMIVTNTLACAVVFSLWGFATTLSRILAFYIIFGALSGSFLAIWTPSVTDVAGSNGSPIMIIMISKGLAVVIGPLIAAAMHPRPHGQDTVCSSVPSSAWGVCGFRTMVIFVGATMAVATCISCVALWLRQNRRKF
ncbi:MFS general substrate transporter [Clavulina sp. PMI_390]|nr:MFS general substrate transporter [Clavulina sp. PMI_390]